MSDQDWQDRDGPIRITRDDALGPHVDDLLNRQRSLLGDSDVARGHGRRWYYQNWFVFMTAGAVAAVAAWAIIEPFFDDLHYFQGTIEALDLTAPMPEQFESGNERVEFRWSGQGWVQIRGQRIWLLQSAKELRADGEKPVLNPDDLRPGQEIGLYLEYLPIGSKPIAAALFTVPSPPPQTPERASLTLSQLHARTQAAGLLVFALIAGLIGLSIGSVDGFICRLLRRALLAGLVGLLVGFIGGFVSNIVANIVYSPINRLAMAQQGAAIGSLTAFGFVLQMVGRTLAWALAGMTMGLGQGLALRSKRLLLHGFLGGLVGGIMGGLLFDPIDLLLLGPEKPSAHWSRLIGFAVIGASVGAMIGVVELLTRDVWLRMVEGPLAGKEFIIFKDVMRMGSSTRCDIYLFNDPGVAAHHATLRAVGDDCEIENHEQEQPALVNGHPVRRTRLHHGDQVTVGRTTFVFEKRQG